MINNDGKHMEHEEQTTNVTKKAWHKPALSMLNVGNTMGGAAGGATEGQTVMLGTVTLKGTAYPQVS
jgi:hypothetical protein